MADVFGVDFKPESKTETVRAYATEHVRFSHANVSRGINKYQDCSKREDVSAKMKTKDINKFYELQEELGSGAAGSVWAAKDKRTDETVALKFIEKEQAMSEEERFKLKNECGILVTLDHPNVTHFYGIVEEPTRYCIATEFCSGGTVMDLVLERDYLPEEDAR